MRLLVASSILVATLAACGERAGEQSGAGPRGEAAPACDSAAVRPVVERFGERWNAVPLLAPDSVVVRALEAQYAPFVTPELLDAWLSDPQSAPGRDVSSPWPERIEVRTVAPADDGACRVAAEVVYVTSVEAAAGGAALRVPVTLWVVRREDWRIQALERETPPTGQTGDTPAAPDADADADTDADADVTAGPEAAAGVIRRYYDAVAARDYRRAYALWDGGGAASGQTFEAFAAGYAETDSVDVAVGTPGRVEPAAGSRYVRVPVTVRAVTRAGEVQRFEGTYTLRRSVVDGATAEQRQWRIYAADVAPAGGS